MRIRLGKYDKIWSKIVRQRDGRCRKAGCYKKEPEHVLNAHHIHPRGRKATRFLLDNGITLCFSHHIGTDDSAHRRGKEFVIDIIGLKEWKRLEKLSHEYKTEKQAIKDFESIIMKYQNL